MKPFEIKYTLSTDEAIAGVTRFVRWVKRRVFRQDEKSVLKRELIKAIKQVKEKKAWINL